MISSKYGDDKVNIRYATKKDLSRIAEIYVFNNRINYWPIFKDDNFSFDKLQVIDIANNYFGRDDILKNIIVYDDGLIKGFVQIEGTEICKLYVDTFFQRKGIGEKLIKYAIEEYNVDNLWALEKNEKALSFYKRNGFHLSGEKKFEEGTNEYLVNLVR